MKKMIKRILPLLILFSIIYSQTTPAKKWVIIQDLQDRIVYLDTSAIKTYDNQLSVWGLSIFRTPQRVTPFTEEVLQIKSNLLFNNVTKTYSVIGTLYYDKSNRIIGESAPPRITGGEDSFEYPIQPGSSIESLYQKAFTYKTTGKLEVESSEYLANTDFSKENQRTAQQNQQISSDTTIQPSGPIIISPEQNIALIDEANKKTIEKRDSLAAANRELREKKLEETKMNESMKPAVNPPSNKSDLSNINLDAKKPSKSKTKYDETSDANVRGNIWSDGIKYVIQLSSWREKNIAEKLVEDKQKDGHEAFLMQVDLPGRGTWYRVRVGYFDTLEEAQNYKRNNNL